MNVVYDTSVLSNGQPDARLFTPTEWLTNILESSADPITATWSKRTDSKNRPLYVLELKDFAGSADAKFAPDELENELHTRGRFHLLWANALGAGTRRLLAQLRNGE